MLFNFRFESADLQNGLLTRLTYKLDPSSSSVQTVRLQSPSDVQEKANFGHILNVNSVCFGVFDAQAARWGEKKNGFRRMLFIHSLTELSSFLNSPFCFGWSEDVIR